MDLINEKVFEEFPAIETERLVMRAFDNRDVDDLFLLRNDPLVLKYLDRPGDSDKQATLDLINRITSSFEDKSGLSWAITLKETGTFIGTFGFWRMWPEHARAEIGYSLLSEYWRKGYMFECMQSCMQFAFREVNLHSVMANVNIANEPSWKLLVKLGFQKEAYFREDYYAGGKFLDSLIYCCLERDLNASGS